MSTDSMRAFVLTAPREYSVLEVPVPVPAPGEAVVDVERVGVCGTDVEFFTGEMSYLHDGQAGYPMRLGHEWAGPSRGSERASRTPLAGAEGDRRHDARVRRLPTVREGPAARLRVPLGGGHPAGSTRALAERLAVPASSVHALPDAVDPGRERSLSPAATRCAVYRRLR